MNFQEEKRHEMHCLSNNEKDKWIEHYVDRETAVARKLVEHAEVAIQHEQEDMRYAEKLGLTARKPKKTFEEMLNAIGESMSDLASSDDKHDVEDDDDDEEDSERCKESEDDQRGWVIGTISNMVQICLESFRHNQVRLTELMQPGWRDTADDFRVRDLKYGTAEMRVPAVVKPQANMVVASPAPTILGELIEPLE